MPFYAFPARVAVAAKTRDHDFTAIISNPFVLDFISDQTLAGGSIVIEYKGAYCSAWRVGAADDKSHEAVEFASALWYGVAMDMPSLAKNGECSEADMRQYLAYQIRQMADAARR